VSYISETPAKEDKDIFEALAQRYLAQRYSE
jgi:hypothetical protein